MCSSALVALMHSVDDFARLASKKLEYKLTMLAVKREITYPYGTSHLHPILSTPYWKHERTNRWICLKGAKVSFTNTDRGLFRILPK